MASQVMAIALSVAPLASSSSMTAAAVETRPVIRAAAAAARVGIQQTFHRHR